MSIKTEVISKEVTVYEFPGHMAGEFPIPGHEGWAVVVDRSFGAVGIRSADGGPGVGFFGGAVDSLPGRAGDTSTVLLYRRAMDGAVIAVVVTGTARDQLPKSPTWREEVLDLFRFRAGFDNAPPRWVGTNLSLLQLRGSWDRCWDCTQELEAAGLL